VFHAPWEARIYALTRAMRAWGKWNLDADRHALERLPPADYLRMSYYERWFHRLAKQVVEYGLVSKEEFDSGMAAPGSTKDTPAMTLATFPHWLSRGIPSSEDPNVRPRFKVRQRVRVQPATSVPRATRGCRATSAARLASSFEITVSISFPTATRIFRVRSVSTFTLSVSRPTSCGEIVSPRDSVHLDLWDDYLE